MRSAPSCRLFMYVHCTHVVMTVRPCTHVDTHHLAGDAINVYPCTHIDIHIICIHIHTHMITMTMIRHCDTSAWLPMASADTSGGTKP
jgi:hypothetical protein